MAKKTDFAVVIGRMQPLHNAHLKLILAALEAAEQVVVVFGSLNAARNTKNPWTTAERAIMLANTLSPAERPRVKHVGVRDYYYNEMMWLNDVQQSVYRAIPRNASVTLVGHQKDASSYYLKSFPQWKLKEICLNDLGLSATQIRDSYFVPQSGFWKEYVPDSVRDLMLVFQATPEYHDMVAEHAWLTNYKRSWSQSPYPPVFITTDAVVVKSGHVLLVRRRECPGKGLLALPGGYLKTDQWISDSAVCELREETSIGLLPGILKQHIKESRVFDHPERSLRGRTVTHAYLVDLGSGELPEVEGADDAKEAFWLPICDLMSYEPQFFEDHLHILTHFLHRY